MRVDSRQQYIEQVHNDVKDIVDTSSSIETTKEAASARLLLCFAKSLVIELYSTCFFVYLVAMQRFDVGYGNASS